MEKLILTDIDITQNTPLGGNIDIDRYRFCIQDAQLSKVEEILGEDLYVKMREDFDDSDSDYGYTGDYLTLYNSYLKPFLIHQSAVEYLLIGAYQIANGGISKLTPQNGQAIDKTEVDFLVQNQRSKAEMYQGRMERWLSKNQLPEYTSTDETIVPPSQGTSMGGWYFGQ